MTITGLTLIFIGSIPLGALMEESGDAIEVLLFDFRLHHYGAAHPKFQVGGYNRRLAMLASSMKENNVSKGGGESSQYQSSRIRWRRNREPYRIGANDECELYTSSLLECERNGLPLLRSTKSSRKRARCVSIVSFPLTTFTGCFAAKRMRVIR